MEQKLHIIILKNEEKSKLDNFLMYLNDIGQAGVSITCTTFDNGEIKISFTRMTPCEYCLVYVEHNEATATGDLPMIMKLFMQSNNWVQTPISIISPKNRVFLFKRKI